ncbi:antitoxin [Conexibacter sp. W3-3-2]|uniref:Antitoxin n=1 Tax=Paraconexibacter algicola TaxID=2133960 RepID=A0A2T4ULC4_9ACTN|nr:MULTISPECIES: antitoxin [Solirubrobacterales]MTD46405.1 antitoxin [Conexibacter sp. W3-3-2]PTL60053.1 antitoxin [Paraconexibacter algicola]
MRTTLDIDDDVLLAAKERARRDGTTAGRVLSELARQSLTSGVPASDVGPATLGFRPLPPRGAPVTNALIDRLREDDDE